MSYYVYMLTAKNNGPLYTGVTNDLIRRTYEHKNHLVKGFTDRYCCTKLVYYEEATNPTAAIEREKQIKSWSRTKKNSLVNSMNPEWEDLYPKILY